MKKTLGVVCFVVGVPLVGVGLMLSLPYLAVIARGQVPSVAEVLVSVPFWIGTFACVTGKMLVQGEL